MDKKELINNGKVKSVYATDNPDEVIIEFRDDMTAGDGERKEVMDNKGAYNAIISTKIFKVLEENGIETQFIDLPEPNIMIAKKLEMIPIEVIIRNIATDTNKNINDVKDVYNSLENLIFDILSSVTNNGDISIKLFEGISLDGVYTSEKTKKNNLTGEVNLVESKIKPKFNISRSYREKLNK